METFVITALTGASSLAKKMQRHGYETRVYKKTNVIAKGERQPWAILNGYMTNQTQIIPVGEYPSLDRIDDTISRYGI